MTTKKDRNDTELIAMCQAGNDLGYEELYNRYARRIYNSIHRIVWHTAEAEDLLQETFLAVFREIGQLDKLQSLEAWIKRVAINKSISHLRKRKIEFSDSGFTEPEMPEEYDLWQDQLFDTKVEDVKKAIAELPEGYRTIASLYLFERIPQEEIAAMLGISHNTVRTQYHRAKKKVLSALKDKMYHE